MLVVCIVGCALFSFVSAADARAETYYISPTGRDTNTGRSTTQPWQTFERAWLNLFPGDTLILMDGVYQQTLKPTQRNGTPTEPITVRAQNDGKAIIDGEGIRETVKLEHWGAGPIGSYYVIEGIVARNSSGAVYQIAFDNNVLRRVSGYDAYTDGNEHVFTITGNNNVVEDCIAAGSGRKMIVVFLGSNNVIRRCFANWQSWDGREWHDAWPWGDNIQIYNASDNIIENSISYGSVPLWGLSIQANGPDAISSGNKILGSMAINAGMNADGTPRRWASTRPGPTDHTLMRDFNWPSQRTGLMLLTIGELSDTLIQDVVSWGNAGLGLSTLIGDEAEANNNRLVRATISNNGLDNPSHFGGTGAEVHGNEIDVFEVENVKVEGANQYNGTGALIQNRYVNGFLTTAPLWPWPMEDRVQDELGLSVNAIAYQIIPEQMDIGVPITTTTPTPTMTPTATPTTNGGSAGIPPTQTPTPTPTVMPTATPEPPKSFFPFIAAVEPS